MPAKCARQFLRITTRTAAGGPPLPVPATELDVASQDDMCAHSCQVRAPNPLLARAAAFHTYARAACCIPLGGRFRAPVAQINHEAPSPSGPCSLAGTCVRRPDF